MVTKRRFAAAILSAIIIVAVAVSLFTVVHQAGHECIGNGCAVCAAVAICRDTLKTVSAALAVFAFSAAAGRFAVICITAHTASLRNGTPLSLKVKLLN